MVRVARMMAIGMVAATAMVVALAMVGGEAQAETLPGDAAQIEKFNDTYLTHDNDWYVVQIHKWEAQGRTHMAGNLRIAARRACNGTLYEDYSCDFRPGTRAADVLNNPTDAMCAAFTRLHLQPHDGMVQAEDGSWVQPDFYSETDYRPVQAAVGQ